MGIEEDIFRKYTVSKNKLKSYGFCENGNKLVFERKFFNNEFKLIVVFEKKISAKVIDLSSDEEYTNFRVGSASGFSAEVRENFIEILTDIRDKCSERQVFQSLQAQNIKKYIAKKYKDEPEFLWKNFPTYAIFRNKKNKKWYALIGDVQLNKVQTDSKSTKKVEIINLKISKNEISEQKGVYEAYHMNKKNWITIVLDGTLADEQIQAWVDKSYKNV